MVRKLPKTTKNRDFPGETKALPLPEILTNKGTVK
jgi:hypothetical protein